MRLSEWQVQEIRRKYKEGLMNQKELAAHYGTNQSYISRIISHQIYTKQMKASVAELEKDVEKALVQRILALGGMCEKFTSPGRRSVPDRICLMPGGVIFFVELKAPGKFPTRKQQLDHDRRRALGHTVYVISSVEAARAFTP